MPCTWLPPLIEYASFDGDYHAFLDAVYNAFCDDFVRSKPAFPGARFSLKRHPMELGKEATFWHVVSTGKVEADRLPDLRRSERIRWIRPMIERANEGELRRWRNRRGREERILIALPDFSHLVVLSDRRDYVLLWTAYCVDQPHQRRKLEAEWRAFQASKG